MRKIVLLVLTYILLLTAVGCDDKPQNVSGKDVASWPESKYQNQYVYGTEVITIINTIHNEQQKNYTIKASLVEKTELT